MRSVTDLRFFREAREKKPSEAVGYLAVLVILVWIIPFAMVFFSGIRTGLDTAIKSIRQHIPAETKFEIKDGKFTNTLEAPVVIREGQMTFIVNTATSTLELADDETGFMIGQDGLVSKEAPSHMESVGYDEFPNFEITRSGVDEWIAKYARWVILLASVVALLFFSIAVAVGYAAYLLFHGFLFWLALKIFKRPLKYAKAFTIAAYAATMPIIVKAVFSWSQVEIGRTATYLYWILLAFIIYDFRKKGSVQNGPESKTEGGPAPQDREGRG